MEAEFTKAERLVNGGGRERWNNNNNATPWRRSVTAQAVMWVQACAAGIEAGCGTALGTTCLRPLLYITIIHYGVETSFYAQTPQPLNNSHSILKRNQIIPPQNKMDTHHSKEHPQEDIFFLILNQPYLNTEIIKGLIKQMKCLICSVTL